MDELTSILNRLEKAPPKSERILVQEYFRELSQCCSGKDEQFLLDAASTLPENMQLWPGIAQLLKEFDINHLQFDLVPVHLREELRYTFKTFSKIANRRAIKINCISSHIMDSRLQRLCFRLSKITLKELAERLQKLWIKFRNKNLPQLSIPDEILGIKLRVLRE